MKRPTYSDKFVRRRAAELLLPAVCRWMGRSHMSDGELVEQLMKAVCPVGGYEIAKDLDEMGWNVDAELVEILDGDHINAAKGELVQQWVRCLNVTLEFAVGASVLYRGRPAVVAALYPEFAEYGVRTPDMAPTSWLRCASEDVQAAPLTPEAGA